MKNLKLVNGKNILEVLVENGEVVLYSDDNSGGKSVLTKKW